MISVYRADQSKRFAPLSYLNYSYILSLNVKFCSRFRFIVFLQISLYFFICQALCWMRGLCISFTSPCFLFPVGGGVKGLRTGEIKNYWGRRSVPHYMPWVSTPLYANPIGVGFPDILLLLWLSGFTSSLAPLWFTYIKQLFSPGKLNVCLLPSATSCSL